MTPASRRWRRTDSRRRAGVSGKGLHRKGRAAALLLVVLALAHCQVGGISTPAGPDGPAQTEFAPRGAPGRVVMLLSGHSGPRLYEEYAAALAGEGYDVVLLDGKDILAADQKGGERLAAARWCGRISQARILGVAAVMKTRRRPTRAPPGALAHSRQ